MAVSLLICNSKFGPGHHMLFIRREYLHTHTSAVVIPEHATTSYGQQKLPGPGNRDF